MMVAGALFVVLYTFIGGFLAESIGFHAGPGNGVSADAVMVADLAAGGISAIVENAKGIPGFLISLA